MPICWEVVGKLPLTWPHLMTMFSTVHLMLTLDSTLPSIIPTLRGIKWIPTVWPSPVFMEKWRVLNTGPAYPPPTVRKRVSIPTHLPPKETVLRWQMLFSMLISQKSRQRTEKGKNLWNDLCLAMGKGVNNVKWRSPTIKEARFQSVK